MVFGVSLADVWTVVQDVLDIFRVVVPYLTAH